MTPIIKQEGRTKIFIKTPQEIEDAMNQGLEKQKMEAVERKKKWIEDALAKKLVEEEPNKKTRVIITVPLYREFDEIVPQLESLARQTVSPENFEVIILVNNKPEAEKENSEAYKDNQKTLQVGKRLHSEKEPLDLNEYREKVLSYVKANGIAVHMIDQSSVGTLHDIAEIRNEIDQEAYRRLLLTDIGDQGVITWLDADTLVEARYVEKILNAFKDPNLDSLFVDLDFFANKGADEKIFQHTYDYQYGMQYRQFGSLLGCPKEFSHVGGCQMVVRAAVLPKIGDIRCLDKRNHVGETDYMSEVLSLGTNSKHAENIWVHTKDRAKQDGLTYSHSRYLSVKDPIHHPNRQPRFSYQVVMEQAAIIKKQLNLMIHKNELTQARATTYHEEALRRILSAIGIKDVTTANANGIDYNWITIQGVFREQYGELWQSAKPVDHIEDILMVLRNFINNESELSALEQCIQESIQKSESHLEAVQYFFRGIISSAYEQGLNKIHFSDDPIAEEFFSQNPWAEKKLNELLNKCHNQEDVMLELQKEFPDYFSDFEQTPCRKAVATLQGISVFLKKVRNHPAQFPVANKFFTETFWQKEIDLNSFIQGIKIENNDAIVNQ
ncbi:MAG: hypothetical protein A2233_02620 [Candidatus Kerfeldbacteria bacterium RIFOXYA2_FULL_38_24]|uniref:Uncharacterized protein n=1 Tax=Candidatus Kerfeldbacteria bacterium RIFOXYB2_FULL_38_14 TaxID=1798547 RepID=A0A1G2BAI9_9BACT|nr:MAG: hypothetical protein A2233_02620 [Candidatus Kerfeldbacteria bacterium RIFOXYA2_FULL_38_24]OGY86171.1 MAG: hypothetical protein A2319_03240 [Candidatus Kerfeldbacteria bacterium RIFOXYB2_FULL_38_14]OGY88722.1 MAG: hypothetical protein A2458_02005 [Candidatus Kerfeldbacteria bacterium RIFOXYC2_FULL_38_9]